MEKKKKEDNETPGPGNYDSHKVTQSINSQTKSIKYQFFGSTDDRFKNNQPE